MFSRVWIVFLLLNNIIGVLLAVEVSFNQPRFRLNANWNSNATTFANESVLFINSNNSIYISNKKTNEILIWYNGNNSEPSKTISSRLSSPSSIFVTINGDIYVGNQTNHGRIDKWIAANETWTSIMINVTSTCYAIFVDIYENLYCSMFDKHRVDKKRLDGTTISVAGSELNTLNHPWGIFVEINLDLYVADWGNHRIQLFRRNQRNGTTVAGKGSVEVTIELVNPTAVVLDGDQHVFIVDQGNHRIIGSDENGFRCIFGRSTNEKLSFPQTMSFDSYGNIYVTDLTNNRVQKISLSKPSDRKRENRRSIAFSFHFYSVVLTLSYNQPRFCLNTIWNSNAMTFTDESFVGISPTGVFVNSNNSIYIPSMLYAEMVIWLNDNHLNPTKIIEDIPSTPRSLFVTINGDIYVDKWIAENETWILAMNITSDCYGLFIDIYENLYCSMAHNHRVDKNWPNGTITIDAGTGVRGSESDMLNYPYGIFVDINLDLYVADWGNNRIQLFRRNQRNGTTVAGKGSTKITIILFSPTSVVLDGDRHVFIVDQGNHRIIGSDENGFRCIFACSGEQGSTNEKLSFPQTMSFDSYGNIYVTDRDNNRVQKIIKNNICGKQILFDKTFTDKKQTEFIFSYIE